MVVTGKRHDFDFTYEVGFDHDGRIEGIDVVMAMRSGNVADLSSGVLARALCHGDNCYYLPAVRFRGIRVKRIQSPTPPFEALGAHKACS